MEDTLTLYTTVKPALYRKALIKSSCTGILGTSILVLATLFLPVRSLEFWGPFLGLFSLLIIGFGFQPFLKVKKLESKPVALKLTREHMYWKDRVIVTKNIERADYIENDKSYGIELISKEGQKLFLPFFSKRSYEEVCTYLDDRLNFE